MESKYVKEALAQSNQFDEAVARFAVKGGLLPTQIRVCHQNTNDGYRMWLERLDEKDPEKVAHLQNSLLAAGAHITKLEAAIIEARDAMTRIAPFKDSIICYASTMDEYEPNRIALEFDQALTAINEVL